MTEAVLAGSLYPTRQHITCSSLISISGTLAYPTDLHAFMHGFYTENNTGNNNPDHYIQGVGWYHPVKQPHT